jgi:hypothetical protein
MKRTIKQIIAIAAFVAAGQVYASDLTTHSGNLVVGLGKGGGEVVKFVGNTTNRIIQPILKVGGDTSEKTWSYVDHSTNKMMK